MDRWTVGRGQWRVDGGLWAVDSGPWMVDGRPWTMDGGSWMVDRGRWPGEWVLRLRGFARALDGKGRCALRGECFADVGKGSATLETVDAAPVVGKVDLTAGILAEGADSSTSFKERL